MILDFFKNLHEHDLCNINFQSNSGFCKICIRYIVFHEWSTIDRLKIFPHIIYGDYINTWRA
jgi:hypothetical protein